MVSCARVCVRPVWIASVAGLAIPLTAQAQFSWTQQTATPEWNATRTIQIGPDTFCLNNWNDGMVMVPGCPPFPMAGTSATFPSGSVATIASTARCGLLSTSPGVSLTLQGGSLQCSGTLLESPFLWSGGSIANSPDFEIGDPGVQVFGAGDKSISESTLRLSGGLSWDGGTIFVSNGATIVNAGGWNAFGDNAIQFAGGSLPLFDNLGAFSKSGGTGATTVALPFRNANQVRANSGTIRFQSQLLSDAGAFITQPGTTIELSGTSTLNTGTTLSGGGLFRLSGNLSVTDLVLADNVEFTSGNLAVTPAGDFRVVFTMNWLGGTLGGGGGMADVIPPAVMTIAGSSDKNLSGLTLRNDGHINWTGGTWFVSNGAILDNRSDLTLRSGNALQFAGGGLPSFINTGVLTKAAGSASTIALPTTQAGMVHALGGNLNFNSSLASTGQWIVDDGFTIAFNNSSTMNAGTTLRGDGLYRNTSALAVTAEVPVDHFELTSGNVGGPGTLRIDEGMTWSGGQLGSGGGTLLIPPGSAISIQGPSDKNITAFAMDNTGEVAWTGGTIFASNGATISNNSTWTCLSDNALQFSGGGLPMVQNAGLFRKSSGTGTTSLNLPFNNTGTLHAQTGTIRIGGTFTSSGMQLADAGAAMLYESGETFNAGAELRGQGVHRINGGSVSISGAVPADTAEFRNGTLSVIAGAALRIEGSFAWTAGQLSGQNPTGMLDVLPGRSLLITGTSDKSVHAVTLRNQGDTTWSGGSIFVTNAAVLVNSGTFNCLGSNVLNFAGGGLPRFENAGTVVKPVGSAAGTTGFGLSFTNSGTVRVETGTINFGSTFTQTGGQTTLAGGIVSAGPVMAFSGGALNGSGTISASVDNSGATVSPGTAPGDTAAVTVSGVYTQAAPGSYAVDIVDGSGAGADRLNVGGIANLGGTLRVALAPGASIPTGTTWTIVSTPDRRGTFASAILPPGFSVQYTPIAAMLLFSCPSDVNHDGFVSSQDFFDFLAAFFSLAPMADYDADGAVTSQDFFDFLVAFLGGC